MICKMCWRSILACSIAFSCFCSGSFAAPGELVIPDHVIERSADFDLGPGLHVVRVFVAKASQSSDEAPYSFGVALWSSERGAWDILRRVTGWSDETFGYFTAQLIPGSAQQLVLTDVAGSGQFLSYEVLSPVNGRLVTVLEREQIFQGRVVSSNGMLIEESCDRKKAQVWDGTHFGEQPFSEGDPDLGMSDVLVRYGTDAQNHLWVGATRVVLHVGGRLYLRRLGDGVCVRTMYSPNAAIVDDSGSFLAIAQGTSQISFVLTYDWEGQLEVEVIE